MKRLSWILLLAFLLALPFTFSYPTPATVTATPIIMADHFSPASGEYVGNARSYIFHYASCHYVARMSDYNKVFFDSRQDAIDSGYRPCKVCRP